MKIFTVLVFSALVSFLIVYKSSIKTMNQEKIVEVVIYKIKKEQVSNSKMYIERVNEVAKKLDGFISRTVHQSSEDSTLLMDYVLWRSLEDAQNAMKTAESIPEMQEFMSSIEEVKSFNHFTVK